MVFWTPHGCGPEARVWAHRHLCRAAQAYTHGISIRCRLGSARLGVTGSGIEHCSTSAFRRKNPPRTALLRAVRHFGADCEHTSPATRRVRHSGSRWVASCQHPSVSRLDALAAADDTLLRIQVNANLMSGWRGTLSWPGSQLTDLGTLSANSSVQVWCCRSTYTGTAVVRRRRCRLCAPQPSG